jgi:hypothetical protein
VAARAAQRRHPRLRRRWLEITVSALLQVFYNLEFSRYVLATGEVPIVGFRRVPPGGLLWIPFSLLALFFAFIWGGWAKSAAQGLFALINGRIPGDGDPTTVTLLAILLLLIVLGITVVSPKITRALEFANLAAIGIQARLPAHRRPVHRPLQHLMGRPARPGHPGPAPRGQRRHPARRARRVHRPGLGAQLVCDEPLPGQRLRHGSRVDYLAGLRGQRQKVRAVGMTFPDDEKNAALWKRWMGFLKLDMWVVFFGGAMIGMYLPHHPHAPDGPAHRRQANPGQRAHLRGQRPRPALRTPAVLHRPVRRRRLPVDPTHRIAGTALTVAAAGVAHQLIDDPGGDAGVLQPGGEGMPQVMRATQIQVA